MSHLDEGVLSALLDGEIPSGELGPIQVHLAQCAECQIRLADARRFMAESDQLIAALEVPATAPLLTQAMGAVPRRAPARPRPSRRWITPVALAATTVLALGIGRLTWARMAKPADSLAAPVFPGAVTNESPKLAVAESSATRREVAEPAPRQIAAQPAPAPARSIDEGKAGRSRPAPESPPTDAAAARARSKEADAGAAPAKPLAPAENIHLDELVVTGRTEPVKPDAERRFDSAAAGALAKTVAPVPSMARKARSELADQRALRLEAIGVQVTADDALRTLGGSIKLIDGLLPQRFDLVGSRIRVVYPMSWGPLVLEEWREAGVLQYRLIPPVGMSTDSLAVIATRIK